MVKSLSVVVPAYNEEANVAKCIADVYSVLKKTDWDWEILVINDGSKDKTEQVATEEIKKLKIKNAKVFTNKPNRGYGGALKRGFAESTKDFITLAHADNQFDFNEIHKLVERQNQTDADIVTGIRPDGGKDSWYRLLVRWAANSLVRAVFGYLATDVDCGFKLIRRSIFEKVQMPSNGALIDTEMYAGVRARGMKVEELHVKHLPRTAGSSTGGNPKVLFKALFELGGFWWYLKNDLMVERGKAIFRWEMLLLGIIMIVAGYLRLYKIDQYMTFLGDEGRDAFVVRDMVLGRHFTLIGPGTSVGNMYLGPLYYYLMYPSLALWELSPVGPAVMVVGFGLLTIALLWWVGRQWFGRAPALWATFLYAISPTIVNYSRSSWNPNIMPFFALLAMYGVWKVWRYGYWRWLVITAVSMGFVLNSHYLGLLLAPVIALFWILRRKDDSWWKYSGVALIVFLILMSPLVIFDMRHGFTNFLALKTFFTDRQTTVNLKFYKSIPLLYPLWQQIVQSMVTAHNELVAKIAAVVLLVLFGLAGLRKSVRRDWVFLLVWVFVALVGLGLYKQHIYDHYFGFIYPAIFLLVGFCIDVLWRNKFIRILAVLGVVFLTVLNFYNSHLQYGPNNQLAHTRQITDFILRESGDQNFNLALLSKGNYDMSYRYFLPLENSRYKTIHEGLTEQLFVVCEIQPADSCQPIGNPLWEIASFGWAKIDREWEFPWGVKLYKLIHNPSGKPA